MNIAVWSEYCEEVQMETAKLHSGTKAPCASNRKPGKKLPFVDANKHLGAQNMNGSETLVGKHEPQHCRPIHMQSPKMSKGQQSLPQLSKWGAHSLGENVPQL